MKNLPQEEWRTQVARDKKAVILDVRTEQECENGIIKDAITIDFLQPDFFISEIKKLNKDKNYYIYCRSGNRSGQACKIMENMGFNESYNLIGGMLDWNESTVSPK